MPEATVSGLSFQQELLDKYQIGLNSFNLTMLEDMFCTSTFSFEKDPTFNLESDEYKEPESDIVYLGTTNPPLALNSKKLVETDAIIKAKLLEIKEVHIQPTDMVVTAASHYDTSRAHVATNVKNKAQENGKENKGCILKSAAWNDVLCI